jgi:hypothetical protein
MSNTVLHVEHDRPRLGAWLLVLAAVTITVGAFAYRNLARPRFNSDAWKSVPADDPGKLAMVDDLLARHKLVGMTRTEIDAMLGTPPKTSNFRNYDYVYWLGPERGFMSIDSEWLCIAFDEDIVVNARLMRD